MHTKSIAGLLFLLAAVLSPVLTLRLKNDYKQRMTKDAYVGADFLRILRENQQQEDEGAFKVKRHDGMCMGWSCFDDNERKREKESGRDVKGKRTRTCPQCEDRSEKRDFKAILRSLGLSDIQQGKDRELREKIIKRTKDISVCPPWGCRDQSEEEDAESSDLLATDRVRNIFDY